MGVISANRRYGAVFFVLCVLVVAWQCLVVALITYLGGLGQLLHRYHAVMVSLANALLLLSPYWLLRRRWRWLVWIPLVLLTLWSLMQLWYYCSYDDLMPLTAFTMTNNVDSTLVQSAVALMSWHDLLIVVPLLLLVVVCLLQRRVPRWESRREGGRLKPFLLTLAACAVCLVGYYHPHDTMPLKVQLQHNFSNRSYFAANGLIPYGIFSLHDALISYSVTDENRAEISRFLAEECPQYTDNSHGGTRRNLVLIIVESLHSWPIGMTVDGREVTPTFNRLVASDSVIYAPHMMFQTSHGHSSDAFFMYNTGLLPLADAAVVVNHGNGPYPSLADAMPGYDRRMAICTMDGNWNQAVTTRACGFDTLYSRRHLEASGALSRHGNIDDAALTDYCGNLLSQMHEPFFLEMITMTMHLPYTDDKLPASWITRSDTLTAEARNYLNCVHVTDSCLGAFFNELHVKGLAGNTVVAIMSDHTQMYLNRIEGRPDSVMTSNDWGIPCLIVGADTTLRYEPTIGQIDVYPTLMDVMGINEYYWKGLGHSILRYPVASAILPRNMSVIGEENALTQQQLDAWQISRWLIFDAPNWFGDKKKNK